MNKYCPECGDDRYIESFPCQSCGFPHLNDYNNEFDKDDDEITIRINTFINSNEYEESKNEK